MSKISTSAFLGFAKTGAGPEGYHQEELPLDAIEPHPENRPIDRAKVEKLAETIERDGLGQLPLVRAMPDGGRQMISGHHRLAAFKLLAERTGDDRWRQIPVVVKHECDDVRALCLLHATNLFAPDLSQVERGRAYEAIAAAVAAERARDPAKFAGVLTNEVVAAVSAEQGRPVSVATVKNARRAYRESLSGRQRPQPARPTEAELATDAVQRALERLESLEDSELGRVAPRLERYQKRLRALSKRGAA